jgi:hypothetical protein
MLHGAIDPLADGADLAPGPLRLRGWVLDDEGPLEDALLLVGEFPVSRPRLGVLRPDVGAAFDSIPHAESSGFECDVDLRSATLGPVRIDLLARTAAGGWQPAAAIELTLSEPAPDDGRRRRRAAFTVVQNEAVMLPLWLDYYGRYFEPDDLYVLDHESTDGSSSALTGRCRVIPIHRTSSFDHRWLRQTAEAFQAFLLQSYETVLFTEADEFLVADPRSYKGLDHYIESLERPAARCLGFNVVHQPDEPPLRFDEPPLLAQRRYWHASLQYCKRLISKVPLRWCEGFHVEYNAPDDPPDPELLLVHLHRIDYDWCMARHRSTAERDWSPGDVADGAGAHNRMTSSRELDEWFRSGTDLDSPRELIPEHIRAVL